MTPQSLLSIPPELQSPDAYRVLGLRRFEGDRAVIKSAADATVRKLREAKATADDAAWTTAAQWVKTAYTILSDTGKKAAYDRKLSAEAAKLQALDPLAGVLPSSNPPSSSWTVASRPCFDPSQAEPSRVPGSAEAGASGLCGSMPAGYQPGPTLPPSLPSLAAPKISIPVVVKPTVGKRGRGLPWMAISLSLFSLLSIGALVAVIFALQSSDKQIVFNLGGGATVYGVDSDGDGKAVVMPGKVSERTKKPFDAVMGGLAGDMPPPQPVEYVDDSPVPEFQPEPPSPSMQDGETMESMVEVPGSDEMQPEQVLTAMVASIRQHEWATMQVLAERAANARMPGPLKERSTALYQLVDLATYYRDGVQKGMLTLRAGNEFDLTDSLKVVIVEVTAEKLIIRFNGKNKDYAFDSIPLSLAHKFAELSMPPDSPTVRASKFAFQAIAPITTPPYRDEAIAELEKITEEVEGAEPAKLVAAIRDVYPE